MMTSEVAEQIIQCLTKHEAPPRVWSFLVTMFGDLAQDKDMTIGASVVHQLAARIDLKPEAVRVALHRLKKEGWLQSKRDGRSSDYSLTTWGLSQVRAASPKIYDRWPTAQQAWLVFPNPSGDETQPNDCIRLMGGAYVTGTKTTIPDALIQDLTQQTLIPKWIYDRVCPPLDVDRVARFHQKMHAVDAIIAAHSEPDIAPYDLALIRVLLVHEWRRLVLLWPNLPAHLYPPRWGGHACFDSLNQLLKTLPAPNISNQDTEALDCGGSV